AETVKSISSAIEITQNDFQYSCHYAFAVRTVSIHSTVGSFCAL
ncbi:unnamed protein product, partial [Rotaria sp. Silwood1]